MKVIARDCERWRMYDFDFDTESVVDVYGVDGAGGGLGGTGDEAEKFVRIHTTGPFCISKAKDMNCHVL